MPKIIRKIPRRLFSIISFGTFNCNPLPSTYHIINGWFLLQYLQNAAVVELLRSSEFSSWVIFTFPKLHMPALGDMRVALLQHNFVSTAALTAILTKKDINFLPLSVKVRKSSNISLINREE
jgi:hypothetical protein